MNDPAMRAAVNRWGLRVVCLLCLWRGRHKPEEHGRLRNRHCPTCKVKSLRLAKWATAHQREANDLKNDHLRGGQLVFRL